MSTTVEPSELSPAEISAVMDFLTALHSNDQGVPAQLALGNKRLPFPEAALRVVAEVMESLANGRPVTIVTEEAAEISPRAAADLLGVSRPHASKLFDDGTIPSRRVGTHRRAYVSDVLAYREKEREARKRALDDLAAESQRLDLGY